MREPNSLLVPVAMSTLSTHDMLFFATLRDLVSPLPYNVTPLTSVPSEISRSVRAIIPDFHVTLTPEVSLHSPGDHETAKTTVAGIGHEALDVVAQMTNAVMVTTDVDSHSVDQLSALVGELQETAGRTNVVLGAIDQTTIHVCTSLGEVVLARQSGDAATFMGDDTFGLADVPHAVFVIIALPPPVMAVVVAAVVRQLATAIGQADVNALQTTKAVELDGLRTQQSFHTDNVAEFLRRDFAQHADGTVDSTAVRALGGRFSLDQSELRVRGFGGLTDSEGADARNGRSEKAEDTHVW